MRSSINPSATADNSGLSRSATASFGLASGALLAAFGAAPAHAQIYTANKTTSAANPNLYFSTTTGASSFASFTDATDQLSFVSASADATTTGIGSANSIYVSAPGTSSSPCSATRYTAGSSIQAGSLSNNTALQSGTAVNIDAQQGWTYPGSGYLGLVHQVTVGSTTNSYYGWASINLTTDHNVTLNSFALQSTPNADILAGAAPAASSAPEPDAVALLALGASGLAALRLRRKTRETADAASAPTHIA